MAVWHEPSPGIGHSRYIAYAAGISRLLLRTGTVGERQPPVVRAGPAIEPRTAQEMEKTDGTTGYYHGLQNVPAGLIHYGGLPF